MSDINRQLLLYCLGSYIFFSFKGAPFFKVGKTGFSARFMFVAGCYYTVRTFSGAPISMIGVVVRRPV
jgi:hypothetical protein